MGLTARRKRGLRTAALAFWTPIPALVALRGLLAVAAGLLAGLRTVAKGLTAGMSVVMLACPRALWGILWSP